MNKRKAPIIPPIKQGNTFVTNVAEKTSLFNNFFDNQYALIINTSSICQILNLLRNVHWIRFTLVMKTSCFSFEILIQTKHMTGMKFLLGC